MSPDGLWEVEWEVYPTHAVATVLAASSNYWFLYEGTPGGTVDPASDFWSQSSGATGVLDDSFDVDLAAPEWMQFGDPVADRSLFVINHTDDSATDSYKTLSNAMTVFGLDDPGSVGS